MIRLFPLEILNDPNVSKEKKVRIVPHEKNYYRAVSDAIKAAVQDFAAKQDKVKTDAA